MTDADSSEAELSLTLRRIVDDDIDELVELNNRAYPAVPIVDAEQLRSLIERSSWGVVAESAGTLAGFVLCFSPGADYDSENYRFFESHFDSHFYIDRIVVAEAFRGRGVGGTLYERVFEQALGQGASQVTCEVNLDPPNPGSIAFHQRMGFVGVGTQATKGGSVVVQLMSAEVAP